jgi:hypothetical protein
MIELEREVALPAKLREFCDGVIGADRLILVVGGMAGGACNALFDLVRLAHRSVPPDPSNPRASATVTTG